MFNARLLAVVCLIAFLAIAVSEAAECLDKLGSHCDVFRPFCFDKKWADLKGKCAKTCGLC
ncbi:shTK domain protein [Oesophagostomum dentatum]|uniref:ShTK domain protein n=1 Tax=Oesophagostomum dentatum TaxID=61180 RepID=A0A0B1SMD7_OESDE|nr:shTK domain protein [Oesophagostomum dentatum]KHJ86089.1 shTK domain protein [Oesophagostomum dentatum]